ncbi:VOC family protein [Desulfovibrio ferrophilus]|uniref:Glyoxalase/bleomycin resistance protein/dioxygenase n=1 Tax=Desulfovibrio ferrophilus TaxID=241368 RepID=A0A2Z6B0S9_9BACT|nr:VOC family protein [Desulfovibrio ferrophilus]BBD09048.1 glyoxalase/bleomycin resistance protein/dioxygenase [Desulfovibrio ferrophilus]
MPRYAGINHLAMVTGDMDATIRFWRDLLGMRLVVGLGRPGYRHYFFEISGSDMIAFFEWPDAEPATMKDHGFPVRGPVAFDHVSIGVEGEEDLWEVKALLEGAGFEPSEVVDHGFIHSVYAFDPNNVPIEFSWAVSGADPRLRPAMVDHAPSATTMKGPEPQTGHWPDVTIEPKAEREIYAGEGREVLNPARNRWK